MKVVEFIKRIFKKTQGDGYCNFLQSRARIEMCMTCQNKGICYDFTEIFNDTLCDEIGDRWMPTEKAAEKIAWKMNLWAKLELKTLPNMQIFHLEK